jgi:hypothetical protein
MWLLSGKQFLVCQQTGKRDAFQAVGDFTQKLSTPQPVLT